MAGKPTALALFERIKSGETSAESLLDETYRQIEAKDAQIGAFLGLTKDLAYETARAVDAKVGKGEGASLPLLAGVPVALKDNMNVKGYATTCGSKILEGYVSPYDATAVARLKANLIPIVGKTNMDEFAMGSSTENSALQVTRNPWDLERVPGGSSGGSAAAVSAGFVPIALGSDTGGSVRQPAALCGLYGMKPTYGLVSRYGLVAFGSSLDQISPFAKNTRDTAAILSVIAGFDKQDSTSIDAPSVGASVLDSAFIKVLEGDVAPHLKGLRVGVIAELQGEGMQAEVAASLQGAIQTLEAAGATVKPIAIPSIKHAVPVYYLIATAEASSNLARFDGVRYGLRVPGKDLGTMYRQTRAAGFGPEVKRRIMLGTFALSAGYYDAYYGKAQKARQLLRNELHEAWKTVDVLICPTSPTTAFKIGEKADDPVSMYLSDIATIPVNLAGIPAISVPCGFDKNKLPIGLQIMGPHLSETLLFKTAAAFEQLTGLADLQPVT